MVKIIPAILPLRYREIEQGVEKLHGSTHVVQIDFVDGHFAHNRTWLFNTHDEAITEAIQREEQALPYWDEIDYEFDLMVENPLKHIESFFMLGPAKIIFHVETVKEEELVRWFEALAEIVRQTITFGMAINIDSDPALLAPYIPYIDTIQCMGIETVGFQGQKFDERALAQIKTIKELYPEKRISVDGGVTLENAKSIIDAGADCLVVGSAIFQSIDPRATLQELKALCRT